MSATGEPRPATDNSRLGAESRLTGEDFYAHLLRENPLLLERILDFYRGFVTNVPLTALSDAGRRVRTLLHDTAQQSTLLSDTETSVALLARYEALCLDPALGIQGRNEDFSPPQARVVLLPPALLQQVGLYCGVTLCRERIRRLVARAEVEALCREIGPEAHAFALHRAATYQHHAGRTRETTPGAPGLDALPLAAAIRAWGFGCLLACAATGGQTLLARTRALLEPAYPASASATVPASTPWPLVRVLVFKEVPFPWGSETQKTARTRSGTNPEEGWASFFA